MFRPSNMLQNYLNTEPRDMFDIVGALMGYVNSDPSFKTNDFEEAIQYVLNHGVSKKELFAPFDPSIDFEEDYNKWDEEYYSFARVYLKDNFCEKRITHVKAVAKWLYPSTAPTQSSNGVKPISKPASTTISPHAGGQQATGKKIQSQQNHGGHNSTRHFRTKAVVAVVAIVLLALIIGIVLGK